MGKYDIVYIYIPSGPQVSAMGGVGWGMLTWCLISVTNNSIEHRNLLAVHHINKKPGLHTVLTALKKIRELSMSSLQPASKVWDRAPWTLWKRTCCSVCKRMLTLKLQHVPFHANIQKIANTYLKKSLHITPRAAVKIDDMCYFVWENKKKWKRTCCSRLMKLKQQQAKKRLTINICRFMRTLKFTANTNTKKPPVHITPRTAVKIDTSVFKK